MCTVVKKACACKCVTSLAEIYSKEISELLNLVFRLMKQ